MKRKELASQDIYDDFKLKKTLLVCMVAKIIQPCKQISTSYMPTLAYTNKFADYYKLIFLRASSNYMYSGRRAWGSG